MGSISPYITAHEYTHENRVWSAFFVSLTCSLPPEDLHSELILSLCKHWLGAYRINGLYSGHIFIRFNDLENVFT